MSTTSRKRKRKRNKQLQQNEKASHSKKRRLNAKNNYSTNVRNEIETWIYDKNKQLKLFHAQTCCVFVSTNNFLGSGICIDSKGIILTAKHCIDDDDNITISFPDTNGKQNDIYNNCKCIAISTKYDLALIQINSTNNNNMKNKHIDYDEKQDAINTNHSKKFPFLKITKQAVKKHDGVYIIGHPASSKRLNNKNNSKMLQQNICGGKIIGVPSKKNLLKEQNIMGGIKHSCVTFGGHSGAPLLNDDGEIVGIHVTCDNFEGTAITPQAIKQFIQQTL